MKPLKSVEIGKVSGELTIIEDLGMVRRGTKNYHFVLARCTCGKTVECWLFNFLGGGYTSCGNCYNTSKKYGDKIYRAYIDMLGRCNNPTNCNYRNYGARGITVCDEWENNIDGFENFAKWSVGKGDCAELSLDRIDVNKGYSPSNCRWVTKSIQQMNRRITSKSGYMGVYEGRSSCFGSVVMDGKAIGTGRSKSKNECARLRNEYIERHNLPHLINVIREELECCK